MNVKKLKQEYQNTLNELQNYILILQSNIKKAKNELINVETKEDIEHFRKGNDLEDGLKYLSLF